MLRGVISAIQMLRDIGDGNPPDFTGKNVIVVGGGNVAMDATRSAIRLGAKNVSVMYRRRKADMTALMDEIEAALDEANVTRYVQYMRRLAKNTQFLVITHRRGTMEEADHLFGVTMQEKGVSRVIELSLDEAAKTIS